MTFNFPPILTYFIINEIDSTELQRGKQSRAEQRDDRMCACACYMCCVHNISWFFIFHFPIDILSRSAVCVLHIHAKLFWCVQFELKRLRTPKISHLWLTTKRMAKKEKKKHGGDGTKSAIRIREWKRRERERGREREQARRCAGLRCEHKTSEHL